MDFEGAAEAEEAARGAAAVLRKEGEALRALPRPDDGAIERSLLSTQRALAGAGAPGVAARLALARESVPLFLAVEATRHLREIVGSIGPRALPAAELDALSRGERIGAVALADAGEAGAARLRRGGGGWRLTARKPFVTNGPIADWIAVFAEVDGREAVCLLRPDEGGPRPERIDLMGLDGLAVGSLAVEDAPVAAARVLGPFDDRAASARYLREANLSLAVAAAGLMRSALRAANRHAHAHRRDGRPIFSRQEVAFELAEVLTLTEAAELLCHRASWLLETGDPEADVMVRCAKVFCAESAVRAAGAALQVAGGEGYRRGSAAERAYRDAKGLSLAGTTAEVARMAIADALLSRH